MGSKPVFRAYRERLGLDRKRIAVVSAGVVCAVAACGSSGPSVPRASVATTFAAGEAALRQGDYYAAEQLFLQVIRRQPPQVAAYYDLGIAYQDQHDYAAALRAYARAQALNENYVPVLYNRAVLYARSDPELAMFLYRRVIMIQRDSPAAYFNLGLLEASQGLALRAQAARDLARAVKLEPALASRIPRWLRADLHPGRSARKAG